jgi:hypothetical protein
MHGTWALLPLLNLECNPKPLAQGLEGRAFDSRSMEEDFAPIVSRDEPESTFLHHPLDFPRCHDVALSRVRVVSYRPFPTSNVMQTLRPYTRPAWGIAPSTALCTVESSVLHSPGYIRQGRFRLPTASESWSFLLGLASRQPGSMKCPHHGRGGVRSYTSHSDHRQFPSCHRVGCMEDRSPLCESIEVITRFVNQYPHLQDIESARTVWSLSYHALAHRIWRGSRASRKPSPM